MRRALMDPAVIASTALGCCSALVEEFRRFQRSAAPARFMVFERGMWRDVEDEVFRDSSEAFSAGRTAFEAAGHVFDLLRMVRVGVGSRDEVNSVGWIDVDGGCFFPMVTVDGGKQGMGCFGRLRKRKREEEEEDAAESTTEGMGDSGVEVSSANAAEIKAPSWTKATAVETEDRRHGVLKRLFVTGMEKYAGCGAVVTAVRRCSHAGKRGAMALKTFQSRALMTVEARGGMAGAVRFAWYAASLRDSVSAVDFGFSRSNDDLLGDAAHGTGVHLSPPAAVYHSSLLAEEDENGERHVVLCRVIIGRPEKVPAGSRQFHPSSEEYDSGVDSFENPRWYVVWPTNMNSNICPEYIVSFRLRQLPSPEKKKPRLEIIPKRPVIALAFEKLLEEIGKFLPALEVQIVRDLYAQYKEGGMPKDSFVRELRSVVGDRILSTTLKKLLGK